MLVESQRYYTNRWVLIIAFKGAEYLEGLIQSDKLISEPSFVLDKIYELKEAPVLTLEDVKMGSSSQELLTSIPQLTEVAKEFKDNEIAVLGKRAIAQITKQLDGDKAKQQQSHEKQENTDPSVKEKPRIKISTTEDAQNQKGKRDWYEIPEIVDQNFSAY